MPPGLVVEPVEVLTDEVLAALGRLLPQLSSTAGVDPILLARVVGHDASVLLSARLDGHIVGMTTLVIYPIPTGWRAHLDDVVVDAEARGHGVGEALVRVALAQAHERGVRSVDLTSRPSRQGAIRLYERLGFKRRDTAVYRYQW